MFGDMNTITLLGNVTNDPELRFTPSGAGVISFSVATNRQYKQGEEWKDEATFHNIVCWKNAETLSKKIRKGTRLIIIGRVQNRSWDDAETGQKRYKTEIIAEDVNLIARYEGSKDDGGSSVSEATSSNDSTSIDPDDLPF